MVTLQREPLEDSDLRIKAFEIAKVAFQQKRKKIRTALKEIITEDKLISLNIDPNLRPGNLTPDQYLELAMETE